jgi:hypothetical protein
MAKKTTTKKAVKTLVKKRAQKTAKKTLRARKKTCIIVKYDCGYHNHLTIRGDGAGLCWTHGEPLKNVSSDEWEYIIEGACPHLEFKILINDQVFEVGDNHKIKNGQKLTVHPKFH